MYHNASGNISETIIRHLPPYSIVRLRIAALNGQYQGDYSQPVKNFVYKIIYLNNCFKILFSFKIQVQMPEGVPGPVVNLRGKPYGSSGVKLEWEEPEEPNGVLVGYDIRYQEMEK